MILSSPSLGFKKLPRLDLCESEYVKRIALRVRQDAGKVRQIMVVFGTFGTHLQYFLGTFYYAG